MKIAVRIGNITLVFVTTVMTFMSILLVYFNTFGRDKVPHSITSTYATTVYDPVTDKELPVLEANYYSNKNHTGYEVVEFKINCYSGVSKQGVYARGFQLVWDKDGNLVQCIDPATEEKSNLWYYDSYANQSFETGHQYGWGDKMYIDIDGKTYAMAMDGKYQTSTTNFSLSKSAGNFFKAVFTDWGMFSESTNWNTTTYYDHNYTYEDLLLKIRQIIKSCSNGTGDGVISLIDLGDILHIYELDDNGNPYNEPTGDKGLINSYFTMSTHYDNRGMSWAKQSMFGSVAGDDQFNITGLLESVDYWKAVTTFKINEQNFTARYSAVDNGFYYILPTEYINQIKNYKGIEVDIVFNISNLDVNVLGFDYYALNGIKVKSLTITSNTQRDFRLMVGSLKDTGLTSADIKTTNVKLLNTNSGVAI